MPQKRSSTARRLHGSCQHVRPPSATQQHPRHSRRLLLLLLLFLLLLLLLQLLLPLLRRWAGSRSPPPGPRCPIGAADSAFLSRLAAAQLLPEDALAFA